MQDRSLAYNKAIRTLKRIAKSLDYVTPVDLWSDIIAMEYQSPRIIRLYNKNSLKDCQIS